MISGIQRLFVVVSLLFVTIPVGAREFTYAERLSDLDQVVSILKSGYGPLFYKESRGIRVDRLREEYARRLQFTSSNAEFYYLLVRFVAEFEDSHMSATLPSTMQARLGFTTDLVSGVVVIDSVDRKRLSYERFPFERGDQLEQIDERPVSEKIQDLLPYMNAGSRATARRKAVIALTSRSGKSVPVPSGQIKLAIRHRSSGILETVLLEWEVSGVPVDEFPKHQMRVEGAAPDFDSLMIEDDLPRAEESYRCSGRSRIAIPEGATVLMREPFVAYHYPTSKGNVGYLRVGDYFPKNAEGDYEYDLRFRQYEQVISVFERDTAGLVIDQDHNCGGSVDFMHRFMSLFMETSFQPLQFSLLASKEQYVLYQNWMYTVPEGTPKRKNLEAVFGLIKGAWERGEPMTSLTAIDGLPEIPSNAIRYTKPVLVLIDEFSGSGGDAFPALMRGYGRAKLLGSQTMGAGGHVREFPPLYYSQIGLRLTKSLFFHPDGSPVENNGARPDSEYRITLSDFINGYIDYREYFTKKILEMIP